MFECVANFGVSTTSAELLCYDGVHSGGASATDSSPPASSSSEDEARVDMSRIGRWRSSAGMRSPEACQQTCAGVRVPFT